MTSLPLVESIFLRVIIEIERVNYFIVELRNQYSIRLFSKKKLIKYCSSLWLKFSLDLFTISFKQMPDPVSQHFNFRWRIIIARTGIISNVATKKNRRFILLFQLNYYLELNFDSINFWSFSQSFQKPSIPLNPPWNAI